MKVSFTGLFGARSLDSFFPTLASLTSVQAALCAEFGEGTEEILAKLKAGLPLSDNELSAHDIIVDLVMNNSVAEDTISGLGAYDDEFPIDLMRFGSVYWIAALEFDDIGYFETIEAARRCAECEFEPFITALAERRDEE
jgi:hypothetical protein